MKNKSLGAGVKVFAPATVGNVACGFDVLGLALESPGDEVIARYKAEPGIEISRITGAKGKLPYDPKHNTATGGVIKLLDHLNKNDIGISLEIHKKMPFGSGLGSSAASAVGGVMAVNELLGRPLSKRDLLPFAAEGERIASGFLHADNVAPSLIGGLVLVRSNDPFDIQRIPTPRGIYLSVIHPNIEILTIDSRNALSKVVTLQKHVEQSANMGGFILGCVMSDQELIRRSLKDVIVEPQRKNLITGFDAVKSAAENEGALGVSISGAGPAVFALCPNSFIAENCANAMVEAFDTAGVFAKAYVSKINNEGAVLL